MGRIETTHRQRRQARLLWVWMLRVARDLTTPFLIVRRDERRIDVRHCELSTLQTGRVSGRRVEWMGCE